METKNNRWHISYLVKVTEDHNEYDYYVEETQTMLEAVQRVEERLKQIFGGKFECVIYRASLVVD